MVFKNENDVCSAFFFLLITDSRFELKFKLINTKETDCQSTHNTREHCAHYGQAYEKIPIR